MNTPPPSGHRSTTEPPIQDLFFNEAWFLLEGLGFGALGWWVGSAIVAILVLTVIGLLSATGVIGKVIIG